MITQHLPTIRRAVRGVLKYGAGRELSRLAKSDHGRPIAQAIRQAINRTLDSRELAGIEEVEQMRSRVNSSQEAFEMIDYGAGPKGQFDGSDGTVGTPTIRRFSQLSRESSVDPFWATVLFSLVRFLKPVSCLEMGGLVGVSTAYICTALKINAKDVDASSAPGRIVTLEGDPTLAEVVRSHLRALSLSAYSEVVTGPFSDTLSLAIDENLIDFAFVDGHHDGAATLRYFEQLQPRLSPAAVVVFDDIAWSKGMRSAWREISGLDGVGISISANQFGIIRMVDNGGSRNVFRPASRGDMEMQRASGPQSGPESRVGTGNELPRHATAKTEKYRLWLV